MKLASIRLNALDFASEIARESKQTCTAIQNDIDKLDMEMKMNLIDRQEAQDKIHHLKVEKRNYRMVHIKYLKKRWQVMEYMKKKNAQAAENYYTGE